MHRLPATIGVVVGLALSVSVARPETGVQETAGEDVQLDVPFLPQGRLLCGGASVAMVQRYWGSGDAHAEDFEFLVDDGLGGIPASSLVATVRSTGWNAFAFRGDRDLLKHHVERGRPVVVLLRSAANALHYVVVTGWVGDDVFVHDPSAGPGRRQPFEELREAWRASDFWALLVLPGAPVAASSSQGSGAAPVPTAPVVTEPCGSLLRSALRSRDDLARAERLLSHAVELCPGEPVPLRELGAVHFRRREWSDAAAFAARAARLDPDDEHAWSLLGASRFLEGDRDGALAAWNETGGPSVDVVRLNGLTETRQDVVYRYLDIVPGTLLTPEELGRARRRIAELPTVGGSRVSFEPRSGNRANLVASVSERARFEPVGAAVFRGTVDAVTDRTARATIASPTGKGELLEAGVRWWAPRPAFWLGFEQPRLMGLPGIGRLDALVERQTYALDDARQVAVESRRAARLTVRDWVRASTSVELGLGVDLFPSLGDWVQLRGAFQQRLAADRLSLRADLSRSFAVGSGEPFSEVGVTIAARSSARRKPWTAHARLDARSVSEAAPRAFWPGAGLGRARPLLLRAYPLLDGGVVSGEGFGPRLLHATLEAERAVWSGAPATLGLATFLDWARVWDDPAEPGRSLTSLGLGLRLHVFGRTLRIDGATRLSSGGVVVSAGWVESW